MMMADKFFVWGKHSCRKGVVDPGAPEGDYTSTRINPSGEESNTRQFRKGRCRWAEDIIEEINARLDAFLEGHPEDQTKTVITIPKVRVQQFFQQAKAQGIKFRGRCITTKSDIRYKKCKVIFNDTPQLFLSVGRPMTEEEREEDQRRRGIR